jgi:hypothetical protein
VHQLRASCHYFLEFGGIERVKEEVRDTQWDTFLESLSRDFRYAFRTLRKDRRFALTAIFALALGIGASTVVFSVVYNVFFHALPCKDYYRTAILSMQNAGSAGGWKARRYFYLAEEKPHAKCARERLYILSGGSFGGRKITVRPGPAISPHPPQPPAATFKRVYRTRAEHPARLNSFAKTRLR